MPSRRLVPFVLGVLLLPGCASEPAAGPSPSHSPAPTTSPSAAPEPVDPLSPRPALESAPPLGQPSCEDGALTVTDADLLADENTLQELFVIRTSGSPCQLQGWPSLTLLGPDDRPLAVTLRRTGTAEPVTLSADTSASFLVGTPRSGSCDSVSALVVTLPGSDHPLRVGTTLQICEQTGMIGPVHRRQDDEGAEH